MVRQCERDFQPMLGRSLDHHLLTVIINSKEGVAAERWEIGIYSQRVCSGGHLGGQLHANQVFDASSLRLQEILSDDNLR
jgi:hypothetical protein